MTASVTAGASPAARLLAAFARTRHAADLALAGVVLAAVGAMVIPLPAAAVDVFIAFNLAAAIALLLVALYVREASQLAALPSLLLLTTLFRLAINVSTTRLVILEGSAGHVVEAFGRVVAGGDVVAGAIVFLVLTLVQFLVVAKGAERVAEVAARFTLDALPGKQMSIDADLRAGSMTLEEAQRRRGDLERESQLYGALDGAMKFVKGDAVAGLVITAVNITGGLAVGVLQRGMPLSEAAARYTVLTIGDGLASQIPALLVSVTAGLVVTRVPGRDEGSNLAIDIGSQALAHPRALGVASAMLAALALAPGLPPLPFLALAAAAAGGAYASSRRARPAGAPSGRDRGDEPGLLVLTTAAPVYVALGAGIDAAEIERRLPELRRRLYAELGVRAPEVVVITQPGAPERSYAITISGVRARSGVVPARDGWIAAPRSELAALRVEGVELAGGDRRTRTWCEAGAIALAAEAGYETGHAAAFVADELGWALRAEAAEFLGVQEAREIADGLESTHPALVQEVVPRLVSFAQLAEVLRRLVREGVSIRDLRAIFEALAGAGAYDRDPATLAEAVRLHLRRQLTEQATGGRDALPVYVLAPEAELAFREAASAAAGLEYVPLEPSVALAVLAGLREEESRPRLAGATRPCVVVPREIRRAVRAVTETELPHVPVVAYQELLPAVALHPIAALGAVPAAAR